MLASLVLGTGAFLCGVATSAYMAKPVKRYLASREANVTAEYHGRMEALIEFDHIDELRRMLANRSVDPSLFNNELLWLAARLGKAQAVEELLKHPKVKDEYMDDAGYVAGPEMTAGFERSCYPTPYHCAESIASMYGRESITAAIMAHREKRMAQVQEGASAQL